MSVKLVISDILKAGLIKLEMYDKKPTDGLKFVSDIENEEDPYIRFHLEDAKNYGATAVYFRHFEKRPSIPQIYVYEEIKNLSLNKEDINILHKRLWSSCKVPMFFVFTSNEIKIYNNMDNKNLIINDNKESYSDVKPIEIISIASSVQKEFNAKMFDTGEFWNTTYSKQFSYKNSPYDSLLDSLAIARTKLINSNELDVKTINSLLIKSMLLKYLEEKEVFKKNYWSDFLDNATSFRDVCNDTNALILLFEDLSTHFNGGIFKLTDSDKKDLLKSNLTEFKNFLQPNLDTKKQLRFWDLYSFKDLPIELISNIYELFLKKEDNKGVVYTPSILVSFMIDEMMPLSDNPPKKFKVIDPSCGSGIFLVGAYKRLIQWWKINNDFRTPSASILKSLIKNHLFGIDEKGEAVEVAKFSLSLALCEILAPKVIWNTLKFDNLSDTGNLIESDFFKIVNNDNYSKIKDFDLVIGNPPFVSELKKDSPAYLVNKNSIEEIIKRPTLPKKQLAYLFLEQSFNLLKNNAHVCMVQPSGFLYNNNAEDFRKYLFETYQAKQIIDFTGLNSSLFKSKGSNTDVPTSVIFFENKKAEINNNKILHITVRQTYESKEKIFFNISYYDFHWLKYSEAINNKYIWKCNLVGGSRIVSIIKKFNSYRSFNSFNTFMEDKSNKDWQYCTGFISGNKRNSAKHLYNSEALETKRPFALTEDGINWNRLYTITQEKFEATRSKELYEPPLIILRQTLGKKSIIAEYIDKEDLDKRNIKQIAFSNSFIGISASDKYIKELKNTIKKLKDYSKEYIFNIIATSGKAGVYKDTAILKIDIDNLPFPEDIESIKLSKIEQYFADDTIDYMFNWITGKGKLDILEPVKPSQLKEYQNIYCDILNSVYEKFKPLKYRDTEQFIIMPFYYGDEPNEYLTKNYISDNDLESLIFNNYNKNINITRVIKIYDKKVIYIIKPKQLRFWLKSIAVRDVDDTVADLIDMRY